MLLGQEMKWNCSKEDQKKKKIKCKIPIQGQRTQLRMPLYAWTVQSILVNICLENQNYNLNLQCHEDVKEVTI